MKPVSAEQVDRVAAATDSDPAEASVLLGKVQGIFDGLEAIRDGKPFRGRTEPREIAAEALKGCVDADGEPI